MRGVASLVGLAALMVAGGVVWMASPVQGQRDDAGERTRFVAFVENQLSAPGRQIRLEGLEGALSSNATVARVTIADEEGVWFTLEQAQLTWTRTALLRGVLDVESLTAERLSWHRPALPQGRQVTLEAQEVALPELPVEIAIDQMAIDEVELGEPVFGLQSVLSVSGSLALSDEAADVDLDVQRLDGPGGALTIDATFSNDGVLGVDAQLDEPANGVLANLLDIDQRPPLSLAVTGGGPLDDLLVTLALDADAQRIVDGRFGLRRADGGRVFEAEASGPLGNLVAPTYRSFFGGSVDVRADGFLPDGGGARVDGFDLVSGALTVQGAATTAADGFLTGLVLDAALSDAGPVRLPVPGAPTTLGSGTLRVDYGTLARNQPDGDSWRLDGVLQSVRSGQLVAERVELEFAGTASDIADAESRQITFAGNAIARAIEADDPALSEAIGANLVLSLDGAWAAGQPTQIDALRVDGATLDAIAHGEIDGLTLRGSAAMEVQRLEAFGAMVNQPLAGSLTLRVDGFSDLLSGAFDADFAGTGTGLETGNSVADGLLSGTTQLAGGIARSSDGMVVRDMALRNAAMDVRMDGAVASNASDFSARATIADVAVLNTDLSGQASLQARIVGEPGVDPSVDVALEVPTGRAMGQTVRDLALQLRGTLADAQLDGVLAGQAFVEEQPLALSTRRVVLGSDDMAIERLEVDAPGARLTGSFTRSGATGLVDGQAELAATEVRTLAALALIDARGAANAFITVEPDGTRQSVRVNGSLANLVVGDARLRSADFDVSVDDAFGDTDLQGELAGQDLTVASTAIGEFLASVGSDGRFTVTASRVVSTDLQAAGVGDIDLNAAGRFEDGIVTLNSARASGTDGVQVNASGRVPLSGRGLSVQIEGRAPLAFASRFINRPGLALRGEAALTAAVTGSINNPLIDGQLASSGASLADGLTGLRLTDIGFDVGLSGRSVAIRQASAQVVGGGSLSASGEIALDEGLTGAINLVGNDVRYSDNRLVTLTADANLQLSGPLARQPQLSGTINIQRADIQIPSSLGAASGYIDVEHRNVPQRVRDTFARAQPPGERGGSGPSVALGLNVQVNAPNQIYVRGGGVDAELGGAVLLTGTSNAVVPVGGFSLIRGRIDILQQRLDLDEASITLVGDMDAFIDLVARTQSDDVEVLITLAGRVSEPTVTLSSQPTLPQDEVLARLVFNRGLDELSPVQLAQLALAAAELAGESSGSGLGTLRDELGLSELEVLTDESGSPAVRAGQYVQENVYVGVEATTAGEARTTINLDVTDDITVRGGIGSDGASSLGIFLERDY